MASYSQFLPQGSLGTSSMPFFMPQFTAPRDKVRHVGDGGLEQFSSSTTLDLYNSVRSSNFFGAYFASRNTNPKMVHTGAGVLTHIVTPYSTGNSTVDYYITVDEKTIYRFQLQLGSGEIGIIGGAQIGNTISYPRYPAAVNPSSVVNTVGSSNSVVMLYSPQAAPINGVGIPFTSKISVERSSFGTGSGGDAAQLMMGLDFGQREVL